jgi:hypothetical protein
MAVKIGAGMLYEILKMETIIKWS